MIRRLVDLFRRAFDPEWEPGPWPFDKGELVEVDIVARVEEYHTYPARVLRCVYHRKIRAWTVELAYEINSQYWPQTICPAEYVRSLDIVRSIGRLA